MPVPDISAEINAFRNAAYGEDVRSALISLAQKLCGVITSELNDASETWDSYKTDMDADWDVLKNLYNNKPQISLNDNDDLNNYPAGLVTYSGGKTILNSPTKETSSLLGFGHTYAYAQLITGLSQIFRYRLYSSRGWTVWHRFLNEEDYDDLNDRLQILEDSEKSKYVIKNLKLEPGSMNIKSTGYTYANHSTRCRTSRNFFIHLKPNDEIDFIFDDVVNGIGIYYGAMRLDGTYIDGGKWYHTNIVISEEGYYYFTYNFTYSTLEEDQNTNLYYGQHNIVVKHYTNLVGEVKESIDNLNNICNNTIYLKERDFSYHSISHQGFKAKSIVGNTYASYMEAAKNGYLYAEADIMATVDDIAVMCHDANLNKFGNLYTIDGYTCYTDGTDYYAVDGNTVYKINNINGSYTEISSLPSNADLLNGSDIEIGSNYCDFLKVFDLGRISGNEYIGNTILTFEDWIHICSMLQLHCYIDHKVMPSNLQQLFDALKKYHMTDKCSWIVGSGLGSIPVLREFDPDARILILANPTSELIDSLTNVHIGRGIVFYGPLPSLTKSAIELAINAGYEVEAYWVSPGPDKNTVYSTIREFLSYGLTGLALDDYKIIDAVYNV